MAWKGKRALPGCSNCSRNDAVYVIITSQNQPVVCMDVYVFAGGELGRWTTGCCYDCNSGNQAKGTGMDDLNCS